MKKLLLSGLLLAVCGFATAAHASLITFYASGSGNTASGSLNATLTSPGVYHVTSITGDVNGYAITGLSTFKGADNLLFTAAPQLDANGMSFRVGSIGIDVNLYYDNGYLGVTTSGGGAFPLSTFNLTAAPEPSSILLMGSGLLGVAGLVRRRISLA